MRWISNSRLIRNVIAVASGTAMAQVIVFAFSPLITRIYSPEVFGLQGVFLSLVSVLSPLIALRYPMAIITAETASEAQRVSHLSLLVAVFMSLFFWWILWIGGESVLIILGAEGLGSLILVLPLALFCVALQDVTNFHAARLGVFRLVGIVAVLQALAVNTARAVGGMFAPVAGTLVIITALAPAVTAAMLCVGKRQLRHWSSDLRKPDVLSLLKQHQDFPKYRVPTDTLNSLSQSVPVLMLSALYSPATAGLYVLTRSVLNLPTHLVGAALGNVLYARFAELSREGYSVLPLLHRSTWALVACAPVIVGLAWFAPTVFAVVFGEEWREAGHYAQWVALWLGFTPANVPAVRLAPIIEAQNILLLTNVMMLVVRITAMYLTPWIGGGALMAVAVFSIVSLISNIVIVGAIFTAANRYEVLRETR